MAKNRLFRRYGVIPMKKHLRTEMIPFLGSENGFDGPRGQKTGFFDQNEGQGGQGRTYMGGWG